MSFDPSKAVYAHPGCGMLPCTCIREHKPLQPLQFHCLTPHCQEVFYTLNQLQEHRINRHSFLQGAIAVNGVVKEQE